jgi:hypothetical protein
MKTLSEILGTFNEAITDLKEFQARKSRNIQESLDIIKTENTNMKIDITERSRAAAVEKKLSKLIG